MGGSKKKKKTKSEQEVAGEGSILDRKEPEKETQGVTFKAEDGVQEVHTESTQEVNGDIERYQSILDVLGSPAVTEHQQQTILDFIVGTIAGDEQRLSAFAQLGGPRKVASVLMEGKLSHKGQKRCISVLAACCPIKGFPQYLSESGIVEVALGIFKKCKRKGKRRCLHLLRYIVREASCEARLAEANVVDALASSWPEEPAVAFECAQLLMQLCCYDAQLDEVRKSGLVIGLYKWLGEGNASIPQDLNASDALGGITVENDPWSLDVAERMQFLEACGTIRLCVEASADEDNGKKELAAMRKWMWLLSKHLTETSSDERNESITSPGGALGCNLLVWGSSTRGRASLDAAAENVKNEARNSSRVEFTELRKLNPEAIGFLVDFLIEDLAFATPQARICRTLLVLKQAHAQGKCLSASDLEEMLDLFGNAFKSSKRCPQLAELASDLGLLAACVQAADPVLEALLALYGVYVRTCFFDHEELASVQGAAGTSNAAKKKKKKKTGAKGGYAAQTQHSQENSAMDPIKEEVDVPLAPISTASPEAAPSDLPSGQLVVSIDGVDVELSLKFSEMQQNTVGPQKFSASPVEQRVVQGESCSLLCIVRNVGNETRLSCSEAAMPSTVGQKPMWHQLGLLRENGMAAQVKLEAVNGGVAVTRVVLSVA